MANETDPASAPDSETMTAANIPASGSDKPSSIFGEIEAIASDAVKAAEHEAGAIVASVETTIEEKRDALDAWFEKHVRDSVISRATDSYNRVFAALETIRTELARHTGD